MQKWAPRALKFPVIRGPQVAPEPFLILELGGANAPNSSTLPPSHSAFDPIELSLCETVVNVMTK